MTNALGIDYAADIGEMITDAGQSATIGGAAVNCTIGEEERSIDLVDDGGETEIYERQIMVQASSLNAIPAKYAEVIANGITYYVEQTVRNADTDVYTLRVSRREAI